MSILIVSSSLNPTSKSARLADVAVDEANTRSIAYERLDLRDFNLPICDGKSAYSDPQVEQLNEVVERCSAILLAFPVYVYGPASSTKNLIELTGSNLTGKPVGLMAAAGGKNSYMAPLTLANALMLDFRCPIVPKYVYADGSAFSDPDSVDPLIVSRIAELLTTLQHWAKVL